MPPLFCANTGPAAQKRAATMPLTRRVDRISGLAHARPLSARLLKYDLILLEPSLRSTFPLIDLTNDTNEKSRGTLPGSGRFAALYVFNLGPGSCATCATGWDA